MPKCPKCGAEIDHLINWSEAEQKFILRLTEKGTPNYEYVDTVPKDRNEYECPKCHEVLFTDEEEAIKFLRGK